MTPPATIQPPIHALCLTRRRSYTSPHLICRCPKTGTLTNNLVSSSLSNAKPVAARLTRKTQSLCDEPAPSTSSRLTNVAVFLGGSCNPTTWRHDIAIPMLDAAQIDYFNPQVDEWYEELIQIEAKAKETAQIVLMVVDGLTRSIVCINEAVEYICKGRKVVLVVDDIEDGTKIAGVVLSKTELADLNGARQCLRDLAFKEGVILVNDVATAIHECILWLSQTETPKTRPYVPRLRKRSSIVLNDWSGRKRSYHAASRSYSFTSLNSHGLSSRKSSTDGSESSDSGRSPSLQSIAHQLGCSEYTGGFVYLGGNLSSTSWREEIAIPLLQKAGIPLYVPFADYIQYGLSTVTKRMQVLTEHFQEAEIQKAIAELILFVIPRNLRAIAAMTEAVELVSSHQALLLVIEPVVEGFMIEEEVIITGRELQDLARARAYLQEMADRNQVAVFESVSQAVENIVERLE